MLIFLILTFFNYRNCKFRPCFDFFPSPLYRHFHAYGVQGYSITAVECVVVEVVVIVFLGYQAVAKAYVDGCPPRGGHVDSYGGTEVDALTLIEPAITYAHGAAVGKKHRSAFKVDIRSHLTTAKIILYVGIHRNHHRRCVVVSVVVVVGIVVSHVPLKGVAILLGI